jgi:hypothetical protein
MLHGAWKGGGEYWFHFSVQNCVVRRAKNMPNIHLNGQGILINAVQARRLALSVRETRIFAGFSHPAAGGGSFEKVS